MLTALLQDRFKLKTHEDTKEEQVYRLVLANNGPKLQKAEKETGISGRSNDRTKPRIRSTRKRHLPTLRSTLGTGPSIFTAVQELGLRLVNAKTSVELLVVDSIEKYPADN